VVVLVPPVYLRLAGCSARVTSGRFQNWILRVYS
jgi:hypothetical protein